MQYRYGGLDDSGNPIGEPELTITGNRRLIEHAMRSSAAIGSTAAGNMPQGNAAIDTIPTVRTRQVWTKKRREDMSARQKLLAQQRKAQGTAAAAAPAAPKARTRSHKTTAAAPAAA